MADLFKSAEWRRCEEGRDTEPSVPVRERFDQRLAVLAVPVRQLPGSFVEHGDFVFLPASGSFRFDQPSDVLAFQ